MIQIQKLATKDLKCGGRSEKAPAKREKGGKRVNRERLQCGFFRPSGLALFLYLRYRWVREGEQTQQKSESALHFLCQAVRASFNIITNEINLVLQQHFIFYFFKPSNFNIMNFTKIGTSFSFSHSKFRAEWQWKLQIFKVFLFMTS